jgi:hypothetical protein
VLFMYELCLWVVGGMSCGLGVSSKVACIVDKNCTSDGQHLSGWWLCLDGASGSALVAGWMTQGWLLTTGNSVGRGLIQFDLCTI